MDAPFFQTQNLFERETGGYTMYRIPGICCTPKGVVLAHREARLGQGKDWDAIDIVMRCSFDNGQTWGAPRVIVNHRDYGHGPMNNFNTIVDHETGEVHALFCYNYARAFYMKSSDDGATFTTPVDITDTFEASNFLRECNVANVCTGRSLFPHRPNGLKPSKTPAWALSSLIPSIFR